MTWYHTCRVFDAIHIFILAPLNPTCGKVLEFRFPGHPAPPLGMLFKMCTSIESWLLADPKNVAAVHCLTGRGRTSTVLACYLAWVGEWYLVLLLYDSQKYVTAVCCGTFHTLHTYPIV